MIKEENISLDSKEFEDQLIQAIEVEVFYSGRELKQASHEKPASVMMLFGFSEQSPQLGPQFLITQRTENVETHKGQMAFPGGVSDSSDKTEAHTALRETWEEVGVGSDKIKVLGRLPGLSTVASPFWVTPFVGMLNGTIEDASLQLNPQEIANAFWVPFQKLVQPGVFREEKWQRGSVILPIYIYEVNGARIWGATAAMLKNLLDRFGKIC